MSFPLIMKKAALQEQDIRQQMKPLYVNKGKITECYRIKQPSWSFEYRLWSLQGVPECTLQILQVVPYKDGLLSGA